jgi:hypothetical protein
LGGTSSKKSSENLSAMMDRVFQTSLAITPAELLGSHRSLPQQRRPSPYFSRVGFRITLFEACSAFTRVTACMLAESLYDPLHRRLRSLRCLHDRSGCYRLERQLPGGNLTH